MSPQEDIKHAKHDYDREYREGAHWDRKEPSSNIFLFMRCLKGGEKVLDAGCGTGRDAIYLAHRGFEVVGIDLSSVAINIARERAGGLDNPKFDIGQIEEMPYGDASFDAAYTGYTLGGEILPQQFSELARVLKPSSILYVAMFTETKYEKPSERDEKNPKSFIQESLQPHFEVIDKSEDSYTDEDEVGKHVHHRLRLVLRKK